MPAGGGGGGEVTTGPCDRENLVYHVNDGAAEGDLIVSLQNKGEACSLKGFPEVVLKADGGPGGVTAERSDLGTPGVALQNGEKTQFAVHTPVNNTGGSGLDITRMTSTLPEQTEPRTLSVDLNLPAPDPAVSGVTVDPIGAGAK
ncbi:DUF4232 domain-containing protein [Streptomyces sp. NPDC050428]|uniref:DUF4232 domain-containing protein n=1 Tax=Streptomyces sp. NPDC050428 TaxID=3155757 RepID=UPI0034391C14